MPTTLAIGFPLGRYHASPWNQAVNEGASEWPPSPWRLLRALIATWHTRWPDLPAAAIDGLLDALGDPPSYRTPPIRNGHTRHYLPDLDHRKGETGQTDLTLDPFLSIARDEELLIRWPGDLDSERRQVLAKLGELMPYLGRAESVCEARLLDTSPALDGSWWQPGADGPRHARLLAPAPPLTREVLEANTTQIRRRRRTIPPGTRWITYGAAKEVPRDRRPAGLAGRHVQPVDAVRFAVTGPVPLRSTHGVLLADEAHRQIGAALLKAGIADDKRKAILGSNGAATDHRHAHWIPLPGGWRRGEPVRHLIVWVPQGLQPQELAAIVTLRHASGRRSGGREVGGYDVRGLPDKVELLFQAAGQLGQVAPELCQGARRWRSLTPYLPVRHRKREALDDYLAADIGTELRYRDLPTATVSLAEPGSRMPDRWASEFRRYRMTERISRSRPGLSLRLEFPEKVSGPLLLGQLSHFGYGIFIPETI
jgi:CRISPR-associated protein Csb2